MQNSCSEIFFSIHRHILSISALTSRISLLSPSTLISISIVHLSSIEWVNHRKMTSGNTIALLSDIKNRSKKWNISVRVLKKWDTKSLMKEKGVSADFLLMDNQGTCIHAKAISKYSETFRKSIDNGKTYDIVNCSALQVSYGTKATQHEFMLFFNPETVVTEIADLKTIATHKDFKFVNLKQLPEYNTTTHLIDVIGVIKSWKPLRATENSLVREITIQDESDNEATIMLWDTTAKDLDVTKLTKKNVVIVTSANVSTLRGRNEICVMSKPWSNVYIDLDIAEAQKLINSVPDLDLRMMPKTNDILHWKDVNRKTLAEVQKQFGIDGREILFTCRATLSKYVSLYDYLAHKQCHCKVDEVNGSYYCKKHGAVTDFYQSGNIKLEIADKTGKQIAAVFNKQIEALIGMDVETIVEYNQSNIQISDLFEDVVGKEYIFEVKVKSIGEMTMTITKFIDSDKDSDDNKTPEKAKLDNGKRKREQEEENSNTPKKNATLEIEDE